VIAPLNVLGAAKNASGRAVALTPRLSDEQRLIELNKGPDG
jgi:hypothetical protein